jgi:hypothetical protein
MKPQLLIEGHHGLGDNIHQRGIIRQLSENNEVWLETSWPSVYHDIDVKLVSKNSGLRTQQKNQIRQKDLFEKYVPPISRHSKIRYYPDDIRREGSVVGAMCHFTGTDVEKADFRLPVLPEWTKQAKKLLKGVRKPVLVYRPLVERTEWMRTRKRNPDIDAYDALFRLIRGKYHVISVADLEIGKEWMVSKPIDADQTFHKGELDFETLAGLIKLSDLVFTSPGFAVPLAQAVGTPVISIFGGYESSRSFSVGAKYSPYLGIDPIEPCECFDNEHECRKTIDIEQAEARIFDFMRHNHKT